jgi:hypothetical protein
MKGESALLDELNKYLQEMIDEGFIQNLLDQYGVE